MASIGDENGRKRRDEPGADRQRFFHEAAISRYQAGDQQNPQHNEINNRQRDLHGRLVSCTIGVGRLG